MPVNEHSFTGILTKLFTLGKKCAFNCMDFCTASICYQRDRPVIVRRMITFNEKSSLQTLCKKSEICYRDARRTLSPKNCQMKFRVMPWHNRLSMCVNLKVFCKQGHQFPYRLLMTIIHPERNLTRSPLFDPSRKRHIQFFSHLNKLPNSVFAQDFFDVTNGYPSQKG